jgi:uncharacterized membrane protein
MVFICSALFIIPMIANVLRVHVPDQAPKEKFETRVLAKVDQVKKDFLLSNYALSGDNYNLKKDITPQTETQIKAIFASTDYDRFFSLFEGSIIPKNWWPILFVVAAGLTGYIYSFGFFKLSKFAAHFWVPYTNVYLALMPFIMMLFGQNVTFYQIIGAVITTAGLMVGVSDYSRNKVVAIDSTYKEKS